MTEMLVEKYRPSSIDAIKGQAKIKRIVKAWLKTDRVPRTILITGSMSSGKTTVARVIARSLLCTQRVQGEACGKCETCASFSTTCPDYSEMDAASDRGIDAVRDMAARVRNRPMASMRRVFVLDEAHAITGPAFQALLKTLEEPPDHAVFILVTTNPEMIPVTVRSRCSLLPMDDLTPDEVADILATVVEEQGLAQYGVNKNTLIKIAEVTKSHPRNALHVLDQVWTLIIESGTESEIDAAILNGFVMDAASTTGESDVESLLEQILTGKISNVANALSSPLPSKVLVPLAMLVNQVAVHALTNKELPIKAKRLTKYIEAGKQDITAIIASMLVNISQCLTEACARQGSFVPEEALVTGAVIKCCLIARDAYIDCAGSVE